ncbi:hypothetical protein A6S26_34505 [Nostoc sp. ATCC 43529]|nr:hypothetical protein A6S26_34505 [Nostoc sp. ATCC 43529]
MYNNIFVNDNNQQLKEEVKKTISESKTITERICEIFAQKVLIIILAIFDSFINTNNDKKIKLNQRLKQTYNKYISSNYYICLTFILLIVSCLTFIISLLMGEVNLNNPLVAYANFISTFFILMILFGNHRYIRYVIKCTQNDLIDAFVLKKDIENFHTWIKETFKFKNQLKWSIFYSISIHIIVIFQNKSFVSNFGIIPIISNFFLHILYGSCFYMFFKFINFILFQLNKYHFQLYSLDPGNSKIIIELNKVLTNGVYMNVAVAISLNVILFIYNYNGLIKILPKFWLTTILIWAFTIALFISIQLSLTSIINEKKRNTIDRIQEKIESIQSRNDYLTEPDKLEQLKNLIDYCDKIISIDNRSLNIKFFINICSTILVPLVSLLFKAAANDKIRSFIFNG